MSEKTTATPKAPRARRKAKTETVSVVTTSTVVAPATVSAEEHYRMVQEAAYLLAEKNGFSGDPVNYWLQAEQEISARFGKN